MAHCNGFRPLAPLNDVLLPAAPSAQPTPQAFVKLESLPAIPSARRAALAEVALGVFAAATPSDPVVLREAAVGGGGGGGGGRHGGLLDDLEGLDRDQVRELAAVPMAMGCEQRHPVTVLETRS